MRILGQNFQRAIQNIMTIFSKNDIDFDYILAIYGENLPKQISMRGVFREVRVRELGAKKTKCLFWRNLLYRSKGKRCCSYSEIDSGLTRKNQFRY
jgi:hypothetical protein